ncbi:MAG TPA: 2-C-methyl-D-erythritol 4-phosphate cytidylyltransferase [Clostridia bacterium]|nr:2-C-methyl-D-erythritol 4-phosphate cytidylyltransferase [Clostridia bacterium]
MFKSRRARDSCKISAVIAAGGASSRMGFDKLTAELRGLPVLIHTINAFESCGLIDEIVVVTREEHIPALLADVKYQGFKKLRSIVKGGATRQQSVNAGVCACSADAQYVCIHDGARPLVTDEVITAAVDAAKKHGAATAAVPVKDTIKRRSGDFVAETLPREVLMQIQTPQVFGKQLYLRAFAQGGQEYSDDCQLVESLGAPVAFSQGDYKNIKLTTEEDFILAEAFLMQREGF